MSSPLQPVPLEFKLVPKRECRFRDERQFIAGSADAANYWRGPIATGPDFEPQRECMAVIFLELSSRRVIGHRIAGTGATAVHFDLADVFVPALCAGASAVLLIHNHPDGNPAPSAADITAAHRLLLGAEFFGIALDDFMVMGLPAANDAQDFVSLRDAGKLDRFDSSKVSTAQGTSPLASLLDAHPDLKREVEDDAAISSVGVEAYLEKFFLLALRRRFDLLNKFKGVA